MHPARRPALPTRPQRGAVLITALVFSAIIAISLASYLRLATNSLKLADRSFYQNAAMNLAEMGIEEALYCYNQLDNVTTATSAWPSPWDVRSDNTAVREFTVAVGTGVSGTVRVYCSHYNPAATGTPVIVSKSTLTFTSGGPTISKFMEVTLRKRSLFVNGLVAKDGISWDGHPTADSWNSDHDNNTATAGVAYPGTGQRAGCTVGAVSGNISLGSGGNVYGYAKTGPSGTTSGGSVHGLGTTTNDASRISNDFSANLPAVTTPTGVTVNTIAAGSEPTDFPLGTHAVNVSDGKYYYNFGLGSQINATSTVGDSVANKNVVFIMNNHQNADAIRFSGTKSLSVKAGSTLTIYTNGNITAQGNGLVNANGSSALIIYGTSTGSSTQDIKVGGNGELYAAIYAPNGIVEMKGGGSSGKVLGSIVAKSIAMNGGTDFHYDEALATLGTGNPFGIVKWRELQSQTERDSYAAQLTF